MKLQNEEHSEPSSLKSIKDVKKQKKKLNPHNSSEQLIPTVELRFKAKFFLETSF